MKSLIDNHSSINSLRKKRNEDLIKRRNDILIKIEQNIKNNGDKKDLISLLDILKKQNKEYFLRVNMYSSRLDVYSLRLEKCMDENYKQRKIIEKLEEENKIQIIKELKNNKKENMTSFNNLNLLIEELNNCYENDAFTAVALLSRKLIVNLCDVLYLENETSKELSKKDSFEYKINWLKDNYFLTLKDFNLLKKMKNISNKINHQINVNKSKEEARKFFQTIKGIIESNFDTKNINFDNKEIELLNNNNIVESNEENI